MKKYLITVILVCVFHSLITAQNQGKRNSLFGNKKVYAVRPNSDQDIYSMLSLGTMFGVSYSLNDMTTYKVTNNIVKVDKTGKGSDRFLPAVYAFPSINLWGKPGNSLSGKPGKSFSMIVPVNINPSADLALGVGFSYGFNTFRNSAEVGVTIISIWSDMETLNDAQKYSLDTQTELPIGESSVFSKSKVISIGIGIYVVPLFK